MFIFFKVSEFHSSVAEQKRKSSITNSGKLSLIESEIDMGYKSLFLML